MLKNLDQKVAARKTFKGTIILGMIGYHVSKVLELLESFQVSD